MKGFAFVCLASLIACGPPHRDDGTGPGGDDTGGGPDGGDVGPAECADGTELVYTIDQFSARISSFNPMTKTFVDIGNLHCPVTGGGTPFSMSVDRQGNAWVLYTSGELFTAPILNINACNKTTWASPNNMKVFGMGFSTDAVGGTAEHLYIGGGATQVQPSYTLAQVDPTTMAVTPVGMQNALPEMTGTGNAELWGFFPDASSAHVVKFDKTNGSRLVDYPLPTLAGTMTGYAFAHWGGDYWVFLIKNAEPSTTVYQVSGTTGQIVVGTTPTQGRTIVGAGVSTCAPNILQ